MNATEHSKKLVALGASSAVVAVVVVGLAPAGAPASAGASRPKPHGHDGSQVLAVVPREAQRDGVSNTPISGVL